MEVYMGMFDIDTETIKAIQSDNDVITIENVAAKVKLALGSHNIADILKAKALLDVLEKREKAAIKTQQKIDKGLSYYPSHFDKNGPWAEADRVGHFHPCDRCDRPVMKRRHSPAANYSKVCLECWDILTGNRSYSYWMRNHRGGDMAIMRHKGKRAGNMGRTV